MTTTMEGGYFEPEKQPTEAEVGMLIRNHLFTVTILFTFIAVVALGQTFEIDRVVDGDTFVLKSGKKVRLIGVDAPESQDPNKPVEYYSEQSTAFLEQLLLGKSVQLEYGDKRTDKYGRLLCYVWVNDSVLVNLEIIKNGYGMAYLRFSHEREAEFLKAELQARRKVIGMWASPRAASPTKSISNPQKLQEPKDEIVYITRTGSKYHRGSCSYLRKSKIAISKKEATARGYTPCSKCKP